MTEFHLTTVETKIFNEILRMGKSSLWPIIKSLGLHKGTVYNSIRRLEEKGFVSYRLVEGVKVYSINVFALKKVSQDEKTTHEQKQILYENLIKKATSLQKSSKDATINVLVGNEGFKSFFSELYNWAHKTKKEYLFIGKGGEMFEHFGEEYYTGTQTLKKKLGIRCRVILNESSMNQPVSTIVQGSVRYLKQTSQSPMSIWVYGSNVVISLWDSKPITTLVIRSREAAHSFASHFEQLWEIADASKRVYESRTKVNLSEFMSSAKKSIDLMGINCWEKVHGKQNIINIIKTGGLVRILLANPHSDFFRRFVLIGETNLKDIHQSRVLYDWKSVIANLRWILYLTGNSKLLQVRLTSDEIPFSLIVLDKKVLLYNEYKEYMTRKKPYSHATTTISLRREKQERYFAKITTCFDQIWSSATPVKVNTLLDEIKI